MHLNSHNPVASWPQCLASSRGLVGLYVGITSCMSEKGNNFWLSVHLWRCTENSGVLQAYVFLLAFGSPGGSAKYLDFLKRARKDLKAQSFHSSLSSEEDVWHCASCLHHSPVWYSNQASAFFRFVTSPDLHTWNSLSPTNVHLRHACRFQSPGLKNPKLHLRVT